MVVEGRESIAWKKKPEDADSIAKGAPEVQGDYDQESFHEGILLPFLIDRRCPFGLPLIK